MTIAGSVVIGWIATVFVAGGIMSSVGTAYKADFNLPDVESRQGFEILEEHFGGQGTGESGTIVFQSADGRPRPRVRATMEPFFGEVAEVDGVSRVVSPYSEEGVEPDHQPPRPPGRHRLRGGGARPGRHVRERHRASRRPSRRPCRRSTGLQIELGGAIFAEFEPPKSELLGLAFAIVILILAFGSVLAMGLPIGVALAGIGVGTITVGLLSNVITMPDFATTLGVMIGLGVGIDYALFIVTRYREQLHTGDDIRAAAIVAIDTAGRAVVFAGITVVISLLGHAADADQLRPRPGHRRGARSSLVTMVAVAHPAAGAARLRRQPGRGHPLAGPDRRRPGGRRPRRARPHDPAPADRRCPSPPSSCSPAWSCGRCASRCPGPRRSPPSETLAYRWSRFVQHHPWPSAIGGGRSCSSLLAMPVLGLRLGFSDEGNYPEETTTRKAYDLLAEGFGPGFNGPLMVVSEVPPGTAQATLQRRDRRPRRPTPGVAFASPPVLQRPGRPHRRAVAGDPHHLAAGRGHRPSSSSGLRDDVLPAATAGTGLDVSVTGTVAIQVDFSTTWPAACRSSSAPCWRCRSCC